MLQYLSKRSGDLVAEAASDEHFVRPFLVNIRAAHRIFIHRILTDALFFAKVMFRRSSSGNRLKRNERHGVSILSPTLFKLIVYGVVLRLRRS